jgi:heme-degrading monooxygenase HmoA
MVLEVAILYVKRGEEQEFELAFSKAKEIISAAKGYIEHQLQKCIEVKGKYILLVKWESVEDHTEGFRKGKSYEEWKKLLHHFYDPFPIVEHYFEI